jgi:hypothetical protein
MTWGEVYDFHLATERLPFPWERELIRELSAAYFQGMEDGKDPLNIEPYLRTTDG